MTNREAISVVKKMFREVNADTRFTNKLAYSLLMKHAKWLIKRDSDNLKLFKFNHLYQFYKCVNVIEAPAIDPCCGIRSKCVVYRTENKIPHIYEDTSGVIIKRVSSIDVNTDIKITTLSSIKKKLLNPWLKTSTNNTIFAFFSDGYLYFANEKHLKKIQIEALFSKHIDENEECEPCKDCKKDNCMRFLDRNFIIPEYLEAQMFDYVKKDIGETYEQKQEKSHSINKNDNE